MADRIAVREFLAEHGSERVARLGELLEPADHPALVVERDGRLAGVLTYIAVRDELVLEKEVG